MSSSNRKILFLIFSPLFTKGGHSKNFINLIKHLEPEIKKFNFKAYIVSYNNSSKEKTDNLNNISENSFFNSYKVLIKKRFFPSGKTIFRASEYILNVIRTILIIFKNKPDIVYAYSEKTLYLVYSLKKLFKFKLIYDMRGDIIDELRVRGAAQSYINRLSKTNSKALDSTDLVFSVSSFNNLDSKLKIVPKYNYYDGELFRYDEVKMRKKKKELKLEDKFVFVYTGNAHYYQFLDGTINLFSQFLKKHPDSYLIIITEYEFSKFTDLLNSYKIPENGYLIKSLLQKDISELQQMADIGFMLREDLPLNQYSFPTKFAEYLASGVPVLMTPHIKSIVPIVIENNLGEIIEIKDDYSSEIDKIYLKFKNNLLIKERCAEFAKQELMWQKKSVDIFNFIRNI